MSARIWYQSLAPIRALPNYVRALEEHAREACTPGVSVTFNGVNEARYGGRLPAEVHRYPYAKHKLQQDSIEFGIQAERAGYDAFVIGSFSEPFLAETRSVLGIPVVSLAEASLLAACSFADRFALVSLAPAYARRLEGVVKRHGLGGRLTECLALATAHDEASVDAAFSAPAKIIADFKVVAARAVAGGADVVIPAEGLLSELLHRNGVDAIDGATILDAVGMTLLNAEMMIQAKRRLRQGVARHWSYLRPPDDLLDALRGDDEHE